jgi:hypothetical protein
MLGTGLWRKISFHIQRWFALWLYTVLIQPIESKIKAWLAGLIVIGAIAFLIANQQKARASLSCHCP